ncbi:hypothetical protein CJF42_24765, partial [Pseudoalteromonas sp. NBT06-2]|uniref:hypothetical protein n=1 Tax=Pseudoalteromonas sp. NBT06-2 TaxID=2025950 RepID=UPI000BD49D15
IYHEGNLTPATIDALPTSGGVITGDTRVDLHTTLMFGPDSVGSYGKIWHDGNDFNIQTNKRYLNLDGQVSVVFRSNGDAQCYVFNGGMTFYDNKQLRLGNSADTRMYHDGSNTRIEQYTGNLYFNSYGHGNDISFSARNTSGVSKKALEISADENVRPVLYYNGIAKFHPTPTGAALTGELTQDGIPTPTQSKSNSYYTNLTSTLTVGKSSFGSNPRLLLWVVNDGTIEIDGSTFNEGDVIEIQNTNPAGLLTIKNPDGVLLAPDGVNYGSTSHEMTISKACLIRVAFYATNSAMVHFSSSETSFNNNIGLGNMDKFISSSGGDVPINSLCELQVNGVDTWVNPQSGATYLRSGLGEDDLASYPHASSNLILPTGFYFNHAAVGEVSIEVLRGYIYIAGNSSDEIIHKYTLSGNYVGEYNLPDEIQHIVGLTSDGVDLWVMGNSNKIYKFTEDMTQKESITLGTTGGGSIKGIAFNGASIWLLKNSSNHFRVIEFSDDGTLTGRAFSGPHMSSGITCDGGFIYISNTNTGHVYKYSADGAPMGRIQINNKSNNDTNVTKACGITSNGSGTFYVTHKDLAEVHEMKKSVGAEYVVTQGRGVETYMRIG